MVVPYAAKSWGLVRLVTSEGHTVEDNDLVVCVTSEGHTVEDNGLDAVSFPVFMVTHHKNSISERWRVQVMNTPV